jgi:hypothetical protein
MSRRLIMLACLAAAAPAQAFQDVSLAAIVPRAQAALGPGFNALQGRRVLTLLCADGTEARTHVNGATANRVTAQGAEIFGTMTINIFEATGAAPDSDLLYLACEGRISAEGSKVTVAVKGRFIGGTGRHKGATGEVALSSVKGVFNDGKGTLTLPRWAPASPHAL